ncbi:GNAT family N-acetyltransferase [Microvirga lotononidis]|uniref:Acetyltransferase n=1 Tax=Microvirga lotononidis TaxID=864069 RepID=I4Z0Y7_9HYPH|nr:GNAT family N-acetyltransferase [Microvirga lotononidis]EIM29879.1 acetyltransferase [Microvirga lotononidis]WQO31040.1 GNAT family N-acetyltransferase [Microvirga lotononidis]
MQIEVLEEASPPGADDVTAGLRAHTIEQTGTLPWIPLTVLMRDNANQVRGGIRGHVALCWLQVDHFWVDEALRGQGYGSRLLDLAEGAARRHGAIGAQLTTSTFQAAGFYEKQGYAEIGRLKDRPPGHDRIWMAKRWGRCDRGLP